MADGGNSVSVFSYFKHEKKLLALTTATGLAYNIGMTAGPWFEGQLAQYLFDVMNGIRRPADIAVLAAVYVLVIALVQGARALKRLFVRKFANNVSRDMKQRIYDHLVHEPYVEYRKEDTGALMTRVIADADACAEGMRKFTTEIFDTGVVMVAYLAMLFALDWRLACIVIVFPPVAYVAAALLKKRVSAASQASKQAMSALNGAAVDAVEHALTYRVFGEDGNRARAYEGALSRYERANVAAGVWQNSPQPVYLAISMIGVVPIIYFGGANVLGGGWSAWDIATFSAFLSCFTKLATKSSHAAKLFNAVQKAQVSWERIKSYLAAPAESGGRAQDRTDERKQVDAQEHAQPQNSAQGGEAPASTEGSAPDGTPAAAEPAALELRDASFSYEDETGVRPLKGAGRLRGAREPFRLRGLNLTVQPGQIVGVTGRVASGKSAFGRLFLCEAPYGGSVRFGGTEIRDARGQVFAYMGHDPELFTGTVRENVALAEKGRADEGRLAQVLAEVQIDGEVAPDDPVGTEGARLSGGQRARLALARALYSKAPVLVLDDPFAAVDAPTAAKIFRALREQEGWRSIIVISHRLELFPQMDQVALLNGGTLEHGTHEQLMDNAAYRALFELQRGKGAPDAAPDQAGASAPDGAAETLRRSTGAVGAEALSGGAAASVPATTAGRADAGAPLGPTAEEGRALSRGPQHRAHKVDVKRVIARTLAGRKLRTAATAAMIVLSIVLEVVLPLVLAQAVDMLTGGQAVSLAIALGYFALIAGSGVASAVREGLVVAMGESLTHALRTAMMGKLRRLPAAYFTDHEAGRIASVHVNDVDAVEDLFSSGIIGMVTDLGTVVGMLAVVFTKSTGLGLLLAVALPLLFAFTRRVQKRSLAANMENRRATGRVNGLLPETLHVMRSLHVYRAERFAQERYGRAVQASFDAVDKTNFNNAVYSPVVLTVSAVVIGVMMGLAGQGAQFQVLFGMSVGTAVALISYVNSIFAPLDSIGMEIQTVQSAAAGWKRVQTFLDEDEQPACDPKEPAAASAAVEVRDVRFGYESARPVLSGFSLTVRAGERVTLTGRTGAGKSTLFKLLLGLYEPQAGTVRVAGVRPQELAPADRRRTICCVEQALVAVPGTVRDQVTLGNGAYSDEDVRRALGQARLLAAVDALPRGLDTPYRGDLFSQGQKQLLMIARAIVSDPKILLLDEVAAGLDGSTERLVAATLQDASRNRTVLSISHRLAPSLAGRVVGIGR